MLQVSKSLWSYNPIPRGCKLYLPLWHPACHGAVFSSIDPNHYTCTRDGGVMDGSGFTTDGDDGIDLVASSIGNSNNFTLAFWFKSSSAGANMMMYVENTTINLWVYLTGGQVTFNYSDGVLATMAINSIADTHDDGDPHFVVCRRLAANSWVLHLDDAEQGTAANDLGTIASTVAGISYRRVNNDQYYTGSIMELWAYTRTLSTGEMTYVYDQTKGRH